MTVIATAPNPVWLIEAFDPLTDRRVATCVGREESAGEWMLWRIEKGYKIRTSQHATFSEAFAADLADAPLVTV